MTDTPKKNARYDGLTARATHWLGMIAMGYEGPLHPKVAERLMGMGLVTKRKAVVGHDRFGDLHRTIYTMPLAEHIHYCNWCSDTFAGKETDNG